MLSVRLLHIDLKSGPVRHIQHRQIDERRRAAHNLIRVDRIRFRRREPRYAHIDAVQGFRWPNLPDGHPSTTAARPARRSALCSAPVGSGSPSVSVLPGSFLELIQGAQSQIDFLVNCCFFRGHWCETATVCYAKSNASCVPECALGESPQRSFPMRHYAGMFGIERVLRYKKSERRHPPTPTDSLGPTSCGNTS